jgi:RNA polymerase sigma factor (sigma-70 family)
MAGDLELWEKARGGDAQAFGELYARHLRAVQSFCVWRTADLRLAEDFAATVFLEAWRRRERLELTTDSAVPLLLGVATNVMRQQWRSQRRHRGALERLRGAAGEPPGDVEAEVLDRMEATHQVREAGAQIRALPRREREVLALIAWGELSYEETAAALGVPIGTVRSRLARARGRLGDAFAERPAVVQPKEETR